MYYYLLPHRGWSLFVFPDQSEALCVATVLIAMSVGQSEATKALGESHRSLPQGNPAPISDNLYNPGKKIPNYRCFPVTADEEGHRI